MRNRAPNRAQTTGTGSKDPYAPPVANETEELQSMEFLQSPSGKPWRSDCGRIKGSRDRMPPLDYGWPLDGFTEQYL